MITFDELKKATKKVCRQLEIPIAYLYDADIDALNTNDIKILISNPDNIDTDIIVSAFKKKIDCTIHITATAALHTNDIEFENQFYGTAVLLYTL
ncbi:MAG: hypothetical protein E7J07_09485 [Veillonella sp.]|uniref:hypothetical protein n=1 Tax=Veillonella sp. TaxID=1926307 RepID=UPI002915B6DD|nr:hypothetical protein [Veillonella sp.]MDU4514588.1 hypothetical protein [Veillonella sp.]